MLICDLIPTNDPEAFRNCYCGLSRAAEECAHRRRLPISEAVSRSINSPIGRVEWQCEKTELRAGCCAFEFTPGHQPRRLNTPACQGDVIVFVALDFILRILRACTCGCGPL